MVIKRVRDYAHQAALGQRVDVDIEFMHMKHKLHQECLSSNKNTVKQFKESGLNQEKID